MKSVMEKIKSVRGYRVLGVGKVVVLSTFIRKGFN